MVSPYRLLPGGILTVADDLLKNDGSKFLEMMEQLAVARSVREEQNYRDLQEETDDESYDYAQECVVPSCLRMWLTNQRSYRRGRADRRGQADVPNLRG